MTTEEAIEIILRGGAWTECPLCDATGNTRIEGGRGWDGCVPCEGYGTVIALDYHEACQLLGKEIPTREKAFTFKSDLKPHKVVFPTFEIDSTMDKTVRAHYDIPISKLLDDDKKRFE